VEKQAAFREGVAERTGVALSARQYNFLYGMRERGFIDDDGLYKAAFSIELSRQLQEAGTDVEWEMVYDNYDAIWREISGDRENRHTLPKGRLAAIQDSWQILKNSEPEDRLGMELMRLEGELLSIGGLREDKGREALSRKIGQIQAQRREIARENRRLSAGFPEDPLTGVLTSTIQSAGYTGKGIAAGVVGGLAFGGAAAAVSGGAAFAPAYKLGSVLGSFAASSGEMTGLLYGKLRDSGVSHENAKALAHLGGSVQGVIESFLGVGAAKLGSLGRVFAGKVLPEASAKIADAAAKGFISRAFGSGLMAHAGKNVVLNTAFETGKEALGEGVEETLQQLAEQAVLAFADAMQYAPVERAELFSPEAREELIDAFKGGIAAGAGFGVAGVWITYQGARATAREIGRVKALAQAVDNKPEFVAAVKESPLFKDTPEKQIELVYDSQASSREQWQRAREEAAEAGGRGRYAALPTREAPGEMRRRRDGRLAVSIESPLEMDNSSAGTVSLRDPLTGQLMGSLEFTWDESSVTVEGVALSEAVSDREETISGMIRELAYKNPELEVIFSPDEGMSAEAGADLGAVKSRLAAENVHGSGAGLRLYREGDPYGITREANGDIELLGRVSGVSRGQARDQFELLDSFARARGLNTHEMIAAMGLVTGEELRAAAAAAPGGDEALALAAIGEGLGAAKRLEAEEAARSGRPLSPEETAALRPGGAFVVIKRGENGERDRVVSGREALAETGKRLRAVTVLAGNAGPSAFYHEFMHFAASMIIPNDRVLRSLLEGAFGKRLEDFTAGDHEKLAKDWESYLKTGRAPTTGLRGLFRRIAEALRRFVEDRELSPELRRFFDAMAAGPEGAGRERKGPRVQTDNRRQRGFAVMTGTERIAQGDLYTREEKAAALFSLAEGSGPDRDPIGYLKGDAALTAGLGERERVLAEIDALAELYPPGSNRYLAPNGKPSSLNRAQWYAVRTPSFKEWFGDWEIEAVAEWLDTTAPVSALTGNEFPKSQIDLITQVEAFFKNLGGSVFREGIGTVELDRRGVKSSIAHGIGRNKAIAFAAVPEVIKNGKIVDSHKNWKGRGYDTYVIDAPITIGTADYIVEVILEQNAGKETTYYLHEVEIKSKLHSVFKTGTQPSTPEGASKLIIAKKLDSVKGKVSQETDANGEPAVRTGAQGGKVFVNSISGQEQPAMGGTAEGLDPDRDPIGYLRGDAALTAGLGERERVLAEIDALAELYPPGSNRYLAPNGKPSSLNRAQWYAVRTPSFKEWFGDWERAARIAGIEGIEPREYTPRAMDKKAAKELFKNFEPVRKQFVTDFFEPADARKKPRNVSKKKNSVRKTELDVRFPARTVGNLRSIFNTKQDNIAADIREIFDNSHYAYSSNYIVTDARPDGTVHKEHKNIEAYHHFVHKVAVNGTPYYIRFTVEELKNTGQFHSAHITGVEIVQEKSREDLSLPGDNLGGKASPAHNGSLKNASTYRENHRGEEALPASDTNLIEYLNSVKGKVQGNVI
jgi:hypothetical protein